MPGYVKRFKLTNVTDTLLLVSSSEVVSHKISPNITTSTYHTAFLFKIKFFISSGKASNLKSKVPISLSPDEDVVIH